MFTTRTVSLSDLGLAGRGTLDLVGALPPAPRLAILGSRAAHRRALEAVPPIVAAARARGYSVVSGGALGIDAAAHRAALAQGVPQIAILPASAEAPYPPGNLELFRSIAADPRSAIAFALSRGRRPFKALFTSRNAHVVGLARAVVVVEARAASGSRASGQLALRRGVPVAAALGTGGCAALVAAGATALVIDGPTPIEVQVGAWLDGLDGAPQAAARAWPTELAALDEALAGAGPRGLTIDALSGIAGAFFQVLEAEALGLVFEVEPGRYARVDRGGDARLDGEG